MPEQTLPITYRRHVRRASYMTKVERLLDLRKTGEHTRTQRFPSTAPALQKFARNFLPKEVYAYVKQRRGLGLTVRETVASACVRRSCGDRGGVRLSSYRMRV